MDVILLKDLDGFGSEGDIINVTILFLGALLYVLRREIWL